MGIHRAISLSLATVISASAAAHAAAETLPRADGSQISYHLYDKRDGRRGVVLMLQGSGCESVAEREWLKLEPPVIAPGYAVLAIEKYGVMPSRSRSDFVEGCSLDYWHRNTLQQRVLDALQVIARLRADWWWNRELIIYGGSEGGAVAAMLAPLVPETKAVVIISSGIGVPVAELIQAAVPPPVAAQIPMMLMEAKANPTGDKRFGGASYRWWADAADITPAKALLQTDAPVLLIQGARDQFAPAVTARATRDLFAVAGKRSLTYREYEGYDHFMKDSAGIDHRAAVLRDIARWLRLKRGS